jgi:2,5-diamino-6-(ribosylamino)-4(3H)-pyrimidinone 5'-phosphate reductase
MSADKPYVIINCAISVDGKLALPIRKQTKISSREDMDRVYELRSQCDAVIVGVNTILADDPGLVVKKDGKLAERQPLRVVLDTKGRTPENAEVLDERAKTIIAVGEESTRNWQEVESIVCGKDKIDLKLLLEELSKRGIKKVLVEGGGEVIWSFLSEKIVDELFVFMGSMVIGGRGSPTLADGKGAQTVEDIIKLDLIESTKMDGGVLFHYKPV